MNIDEVFWHRARRVVRRDNTIDLGGRRYELSTMRLAGRRLEVRFDPRDADVPPKVFGDDGFLGDTRALDLHATCLARLAISPAGSLLPSPVNSLRHYSLGGPSTCAPRRVHVDGRLDDSRVHSSGGGRAQDLRRQPSN